MTTPDILDEDHIKAGAARLRACYRKTAAGLPSYTGSLFNRWGGGGDSLGVVNRITPDDLIAVSFPALDAAGEQPSGFWKLIRH